MKYYEDQILLENTYALVIEEQQILNELDRFLQEEDFLQGLQDAGKFVKDKAGQIAQDTADKAADLTQGAAKKVEGITKGSQEALQCMADLPAKLQKWSTVDIPQFIDQATQFLLNAGTSFAVGGCGTWFLGQLLMHLSRKISKNANMNSDALKASLPTFVQDEMAALEDLKETNPKEWEKQAFMVYHNKINDLNKKLKEWGFNTDEPVLAKAFNFIGKALTNPYAAALGGIVFSVLLHKLGFNPMPSFPGLK